MPKATAFSFLTNHQPGEELVSGSIGGECYLLTNDANATLNIGDLVVLSGNVTVDKVAANPTNFKGIVVAGALTDYRIPDGLTAAQITAGIPAADAGQQVYVLVYGIFYVVADGAIANGAPFIPSATAGKVTAGTTANEVIGRILGAATVNDGDIGLAFINPN